MIAVTIIEDDIELINLWAEFINSTRGFICISTYTNCETALEKIKTDKPDVILMDITLAGNMTGIEGIAAIKKLLPLVSIIMVTVNEDDESIFSSLRAGAIGYLVKNISLEKLLTSIKMISNGGSPMTANVARKVAGFFQHSHIIEELSPKELAILKLLCEGKSQKQIAALQGIKIETVKFHIHNIYLKLHVNNAAQAGHVAGKLGIV